MILKYLGIFSFIALLPSAAKDRETLPWQAFDDRELHRLALQIGDRFDPEEVFGAPAVSRTDGVRIRVYPRGTRDLLIVETSAGNKESPELERFHAIRLKRAFEVKAVGLEAGTFRTVWEICTRRTKPVAANGLFNWFRK